MSLSIGIGFSPKASPQEAVDDAVTQAKSMLGETRADIAIILSTIHYDPYITLPLLHSSLKTPRIIGCSTAGIILSDNIATHGFGVLLIRSDEMSFGIGSVQSIARHNIKQAGSDLAQNCLHHFDADQRKCFLFFADGNIENNFLLLQGLQSVFGNIFPIIGAGSCDDFKFKQSFQLFQDDVMNFSAAGLLMGGHMGIGLGASHGWRPLGKPRIATKVEGNIIKLIDNQDASKIYYEYFEDEARHFHLSQFGKMNILYPLGIYIEESGDYLLRNVVRILDDGSLVCQGDIPQGCEVHVMIGNKESCKEAAAEAAAEAKKNLFGKKPKLIIVFESIARLKLLGRSAFEEIKKIKTVFGDDVPVFGMYSNGEICPFQSVQNIKKPYLQNASIVTLAVSE